jgi:hypothetical protein
LRDLVLNLDSLTANRNTATLAIVQALVFVGVLALAALPTIAPGSSSTTSPPPSVCEGLASFTPNSFLAPISETLLANGTAFNETSYPALFLRPNSPGVICVTYADAFSGYTISLAAGKNYFAGTFNITKQSNGGETIAPIPISAAILSISANPSEIDVQPGRSEVVAYTLTSSSNSTGVYQAFFPPASCAGLPVFVGGDISQINATGYSQLAFINGMACTDLYGNLSVQSIALGNITVNYVGQPTSASKR